MGIFGIKRREAQKLNKVEELENGSSHKIKGDNIMEIKKQMTIAEIISVDPAIADILLESGMHCLGCVMASGENLEQACSVHGIDCDALVDRINLFLAEKQA